MRRLICLFMLMLLPLHALAMHDGLSDHAFDIGHATVHADGISHHHESDGTIHFDQSEESDQHASDTSNCCQSVAPPSTISLRQACASCSTAHVPPVPLIPDGIVTLPIRPPRHFA